MPRSENRAYGRWPFTAFILRSLVREYGLSFLFRVAAAHPLRTLKGLGRTFKTGAGPPSDPSHTELSRFTREADKDGPGIVGLGFCLKPMEPVCPSGRANHECMLLEGAYWRRSPIETAPIPGVCSSCLIRDIGSRALSAGWSFYIMTSAADILRDLLLPALKGGRYKKAILGLCGFSFTPFRFALETCGIQSLMFPYRSGDCRDYRTWRRADLGIKEDRTEIDFRQREDIIRLLESAPIKGSSASSGDRVGHVFSPACPFSDIMDSDA